MNHSYAWQKAWETVNCLTGCSDFDTRLRNAARPLSQFPSRGVPGDIQRQAIVASRAFTMCPTPHRDGAAAGVIPLLPEARKEELASKVVNLFQSVCNWEGAGKPMGSIQHQLADSDLGCEDKWEFLYWGTSTQSPQREQDLFVNYARHFLPRFPREVLLEWIGRHGREQVRRWAHLDFESLRFENARLPLSQILKIDVLPGSDDYLALDATEGAQHRARDGNWLAQQVCRLGTWPHPIVVFESPAPHTGPDGRVPDGLVLIEGHRRLSMLRNTPATELLPDHRVWIARAA